MKKKVAILTYHNAVNYGAVLQAFSTKEFLNMNGYDVEIINYCCPSVAKQYIFEAFHEAISIKEFISHNVTALIRNKKSKNFERFHKMLIENAEEVKYDDLEQYLEQFDAVIVGSDQVWNSYANGGDTAYLLPFNNIKKIGYAVSSGSLNNLKYYAKYNKNYLNLIKKYDYLSFRENEISEFISCELNRKCDVVLDPVFLLSKNTWLKQAIPMNEGNRFIFVYNLGENPLLYKAIKKLSELTKLKVCMVNKDIKGDVLAFGKYKVFSNISAENFLGFIYEAEYIITDSFHATAFSIIFEKQFYTVFNRNKDNTNSRLDTLLKAAGLENRAIASGDMDIIQNSDNAKIDYENVSKQLNELIGESTSFLLNSLNN